MVQDFLHQGKTILNPKPLILALYCWDITSRNFSNNILGGLGGFGGYKPSYVIISSHDPPNSSVECRVKGLRIKGLEARA